MTKRTKRLQISITEKQNQILNGLSDLTETPKSTLIYEFIEIAFPSLELLLKNLQQAETLDKQLKKEIANNLDEAVKTNQEALKMLSDVLAKRGDTTPVK